MSCADAQRSTQQHGLWFGAEEVRPVNDSHANLTPPDMPGQHGVYLKSAQLFVFVFFCNYPRPGFQRKCDDVIVALGSECSDINRVSEAARRELTSE